MLHVEYRADRGPRDESRTDQLVTELTGAVARGFPSGFDLAVVDRDGALVRAWGGMACRVDQSVLIERRTRYDLASLTKVVATTTLVLWLAQSRRWRLSDKVGKWLPRFPRPDLTLYELLTHTSGLVPHRPFFHLGCDSQAIRRALYAECERGSAPGEVLYSDLNFMLLGWAVARCSRRPLHRLFDEVIARQLELTGTRYRPTANQRPLTAATELNGDQRMSPGLTWGEVHDGNAWALGGVAGHAGLFAPAEDMIRFVATLLRPRQHPVLSAASIASITAVKERGGDDVRGLGWRLDPSDWGVWPEGTYWHTGFTGTSLLVAPAAGLAVVLLSNAIHPRRQLSRQADFRCDVHRAIARSWL